MLAAPAVCDGAVAVLPLAPSTRSSIQEMKSSMTAAEMCSGSFSRSWAAPSYRRYVLSLDADLLESAEKRNQSEGSLFVFSNTGTQPHAHTHTEQHQRITYEKSSSEPSMLTARSAVPCCRMNGCATWCNLACRCLQASCNTQTTTSEGQLQSHALKGRTCTIP